MEELVFVLPLLLPLALMCVSTFLHPLGRKFSVARRRWFRHKCDVVRPKCISSTSHRATCICLFCCSPEPHQFYLCSPTNIICAREQHIRTFPSLWTHRTCFSFHVGWRKSCLAYFRSHGQIEILSKFSLEAIVQRPKIDQNSHILIYISLCAHREQLLWVRCNCGRSLCHRNLDRLQ